MTETLLEKIVSTKSEIVILDITGVPVVDTSVSRHLLETISAARLLGAEVLLVGLTSKTAITLVHLGLDLTGVTTRTTMARGLQLAFGRLGLEVIKNSSPSIAAHCRFRLSRLVTALSPR
jgi:rsbT co-antagonist protein RsbR